MSKNNEDHPKDSSVFIGYIEEGDKIKDEFSIECESTGEGSSQEPSDDPPWLTNKIGGAPIFPDHGFDLEKLEAALESIRCRHCKNSCALMMQIKCPIDDSSFHRVVQVYTCVDDKCIRHSWFALRCMYPGTKSESQTIDECNPNLFEMVRSPYFGKLLVCRGRAFFNPFYLSVIEEPTGREDFAKNNIEAMKLAINYEDPDGQPHSIEAKYKNLKNYKPPKPPANLSDLDSFEKFQMELLYGNDKCMYRFYKRVSRFPSQVCRYDWEGQPLLNSQKINPTIPTCSCCSSQRKFEFQVMPALINYLESSQEFDRESHDFSSILIHSCSRNCSSETFVLEDTFSMPDPDSRLFNKVKQRVLAVKLGDTQEAGDKPQQGNSGGVSRKKRNRKKNKK